MIALIEITLFVLSGGIFFINRGEKNRVLLLMAGALAVLATSVFIYDMSLRVKYWPNASPSENESLSSRIESNPELGLDGAGGLSIELPVGVGARVHPTEAGRLLVFSDSDPYEESQANFQIINSAGQVEARGRLEGETYYSRVTVERSGAFVIAACQIRSFTDCDLSFSSYGSGGELRWKKSFGNSEVFPRSVHAVENEGYYIVGSRPGRRSATGRSCDNTTVGVIMEIDLSGQLISVNEIEIPDLGSVTTSILGESGGIFMVGQICDLAAPMFQNYVPFVASLSTSGNPEWVKLLPDFRGFGFAGFVQPNSSWLALRLKAYRAPAERNHMDVVYGISPNGVELMVFDTRFARGSGLAVLEDSQVGLLGETLVGARQGYEFLTIDGSRRFSYSTFTGGSSEGYGAVVSIGDGKLAVMGDSSISPSENLRELIIFATE